MPAAPLAPPAPAWRDLTLSLEQVMAVAWRMLWRIGLATFAAYVLLWGWPALPAPDAWPAFAARVLLQGLAFLGVYLVSAVLHEGLHAFAMVAFARISPRAIRFGLRLREGVAYVHAAAPMTARAYRAVLVLPGLVQGVVPLAAGLALGSGWLTLYGYVMLVSAAGDVAVFMLLRPLAPGERVIDHPQAVGCRVAV